MSNHNRVKRGFATNLPVRLALRRPKMLPMFYVYAVQRKKFGGALRKRDKESTTQDLVSNNGSLATFSMQ